MDIKIIFTTIKIVLKREGTEIKNLEDFDQYKKGKESELLETTERK